MTAVTLSELPNFNAKSQSSSAASEAFFPAASALLALVTASVPLTTSHNPSEAIIRNSCPGRREIDRHSGTGRRRSAWNTCAGSNSTVQFAERNRDLERDGNELHECTSENHKLRVLLQIILLINEQKDTIGVKASLFKFKNTNLIVSIRPNEECVYLSTRNKGFIVGVTYGS
jgi:hypothetical protein